MKGILRPRNYFQFPLVKVIISKIAYTSFENTKNEDWLRTSHRKVVREIFEGFRIYHIVQNRNGTEQCYQSHQLLTESNVIEARNDTNEENRTTIAPEFAYKKHTRWLIVDQLLTHDNIEKIEYLFLKTHEADCDVLTKQKNDAIEQIHFYYIQHPI